MVKYGDKLRYFRKKTKLTLEEAADVIDIAESSLALYERNEKRIPISVFIKLACLYGFDVYDVFQVHDPEDFEEDIPLYNIIDAHCRYLIACRIKSDTAFGNNAPEEYYNESYRQLIHEYVSNPDYRKSFPGLDEAVLPDKYFK